MIVRYASDKLVREKYYYKAAMFVIYKELKICNNKNYNHIILCCDHSDIPERLLDYEKLKDNNFYNENRKLWEKMNECLKKFDYISFVLCYNIDIFTYGDEFNDVRNMVGHIEYNSRDIGNHKFSWYEDEEPYQYTFDPDFDYDDYEDDYEENDYEENIKENEESNINHPNAINIKLKSKKVDF